MILKPNLAETWADYADMPRHPVADLDDAGRYVIVLGIDGFGINCAILLGGSGETATRHAVMVAPKDAGR